MDADDLWIVEHFSELVTKYARQIRCGRERLTRSWSLWGLPSGRGNQGTRSRTRENPVRAEGA